MKTILWIIPFVLTFLPLNTFGFGYDADAKSKSIRLDSTVNALAEEKYVCLSASDGWGRILSGWEKQQELERLADSKTLSELADKHSSATVRVASFMLLVRRNKKLCVPLMFAHLRDTAEVGAQAYDVVHSCETVANVMVSLVTGHDMAEERKLLTGQEAVTLDSILIFVPQMSHIDRQRTVMQKLPADEKYYDRLVEMYEQEKIMEALPVIAKFRKSSDKARIIAALNQYPVSKGIDEYGFESYIFSDYLIAALNAVAVWPDADFLPLLKDVKDYDVANPLGNYVRYESLYAALMAYSDRETYCMIDETLALKILGHTSAFQRAFDKNPNPLYAPLVDKYCYAFY